MILVNLPAISHPFPPVILHDNFPLGLYINTPLKMSIAPAIVKIQPFFSDKGTNQGKLVIMEVTAAPPANVAIKAGRAQQIKVPVEVNRDKKLDIFCCQF